MRLSRAMTGLGLAVALGLGAPVGRAAEEPPAAAEHVAEEEGHAAAHGEHGEEHEQEFNWSNGFLGEKDGVEPSLLYRPKGTPAPFLANVVNALLLFAIIVGFGKKPIAEALKKRKERIVAGMEEAGKMKADAATRLEEYEEKIRHLDEEIERIKREMREAAEMERRRILAEAQERHERMERDARLLVEQELKAARELLVRETVGAAVRSAEEILTKQLAATDQDRLAKEFLEQLQKTPLSVSGGRA